MSFGRVYVGKGKNVGRFDGKIRFLVGTTVGEFAREDLDYSNSSRPAFPGTSTIQKIPVSYDFKVVFLTLLKGIH